MTYDEMLRQWALKQFKAWSQKEGPVYEDGHRCTWAEDAFLAGVAAGDSCEVALMRAQAILHVTNNEGRPVAIVKIIVLRGDTPYMGLGMVVNTTEEGSEADVETITGACAIAYNMVEEAAAGALTEVDLGPTEVGQEGRPM